MSRAKTRWSTGTGNGVTRSTACLALSNGVARGIYNSRAKKSRTNVRKPDPRSGRA